LEINLRKNTIDGCQQLFALVLPLEFGDACFLGDFSQLAPGFITLRLEAKGVTLVVGSCTTSRSRPAELDSWPAWGPGSIG
jgi:hypothetical protein